MSRSWLQDSLCVFRQLGYAVSGCGSFSVYPTWSLLSVLNKQINVFLKFLDVHYLDIISSNCLSAFFCLSSLGTLTVYVLAQLMVPPSSQRLCPLFVILVVFVRYAGYRSFGLCSGSLILSSASNLMLTPVKGISHFSSAFQLQNFYLALFFVEFPFYSISFDETLLSIFLGIYEQF